MAAAPRTRKPSPSFAEPALPGVQPEEAGASARDDQHYHGHRDRLRGRFLTGGAEALQDYELLELILFSVDPQKDVKPLAKELIRSLGGLWNVVNAPPEKLRPFKVGGVSLKSDRAVAIVRAVGAAALCGMRQEVMKRPVLGSWQALLDYIQAAMAHETTEQFRLLFLDIKNTLIADEVQQRGTVDHTPVYPREVVKRALELAATAIILVHNHPSGDPSPSRADIDMTKEIIRALDPIGVTVHDHIIVGKGKHASFKALRLL